MIFSGAESLKYLTKGIELLKHEEKDEIRKLSKAYCNIAELYMTDLCMDKEAQQKCQVRLIFKCSHKRERGGQLSESTI